ncbi:hypothetical protein [Lentzea nigeriaca]|uniref:hypothetical protein n=1 Tax=Lentzea nigeriaca TaxID=1128665 RepID=UPI00195CDB4E|nr:hypothetical protein [Lentzea nigeriaca]MBM7856239.1 hypothetical protein [Lentzea nigeriaca]
MKSIVKPLAVTLAALFTVLTLSSQALAAPGSTGTVQRVGTQQAVSVHSVDGYYDGSVVVSKNDVTANGHIEDTGFHRKESALYINITSSAGTYNIPFVTVGNNKGFTFPNRHKTFPGTFIRGTATMCSWKNKGSGSVWDCGTPQSLR